MLTLIKRTFRLLLLTDAYKSHILSKNFYKKPATHAWRSHPGIVAPLAVYFYKLIYISQPKIFSP